MVGVLWLARTHRPLDKHGVALGAYASVYKPNALWCVITISSNPWSRRYRLLRILHHIGGCIGLCLAFRGCTLPNRLTPQVVRTCPRTDRHHWGKTGAAVAFGCNVHGAFRHNGATYAPSGAACGPGPGCYRSWWTPSFGSADIWQTSAIGFRDDRSVHRAYVRFWWLPVPFTRPRASCVAHPVPSSVWVGSWADRY